MCKADGNAVVDTNNTPAFDLDRIVEAQTGVTNTSSNHSLLDPLGMNPNYVQLPQPIEVQAGALVPTLLSFSERDTSHP